MRAIAFLSTQPHFFIANVIIEICWHLNPLIVLKKTASEVGVHLFCKTYFFHLCGYALLDQMQSKNAYYPFITIERRFSPRTPIEFKLDCRPAEHGTSKFGNSPTIAAILILS